MGRDGLDEGVDLGDRLLHCAAEDLLAESGGRPRARIDAFLFEGVKEERERPFRVRAAVDAEIPLLGQGIRKRTLDVLPAAYVAVVHPHQRVVLEGVTVVLGQGAFGGGAHMGKDQSRAYLGRDALEVDAVPSRKGGGEDTRGIAQVSFCVPADTEAVTVDWAALVKAEPRVVRLRED